MLSLVEIRLQLSKLLAVFVPFIVGAFEPAVAESALLQKCNCVSARWIPPNEDSSQTSQNTARPGGALAKQLGLAVES